MGSSQTKEKRSCSRSEKAVEGLKEKVRVLQGEINEMKCVRERENQMYEREIMVLAFKQAEWRRERKRLKEEMKKLRDEREDNMNKEEQQSLRRDETVEKWKQLYFAIKLELDHLIVTTHQGERLCWNAGEEEEKKEELRIKEEKIQLLEAKIAMLENQELKREREVDILRQSLRIMSHKKRSTIQGC